MKTNKRERKRLIVSVWQYLQNAITAAYINRNEIEFDWYSEGQGVYWNLLNNEPIKIVRRVKSL